MGVSAATMRLSGGRPLSTVLAVATLALGIGSSVALFGIVDAVLLRPLPFAASDQLVAVWDAAPAAGIERSRVSAFNYRRFVEEGHSFDSMALLGTTSGAVVGLGEPFEVDGMRVTCNTFALLGVPALLGRGLLAGDCEGTAPRVMVLSNALWIKRFSGLPAVVGSNVSFGGEPMTVVGVLPPVLLPAGLAGAGRFIFDDAAEDVYVPLAPLPQNRGHVFGVLGRLRKNAAIAAARTDLGNIADRLAAAEPDSHRNAAVRVFPLADEIAGSARRSLGALLAAALALLAIACLNVAQIQLTAVLDREHASAVRASLGASPLQVARPFVVSGLAMAAAGGALGTTAAFATLRLASSFLPSDLPRIGAAAVDGRALAVAVALSLGAGCAVGLVAAWRAARRDPVESLRQGARAVVPGGTIAGVRGILMAGQAALAVTLLASAALLGATFARLRQVDTGFDRGEVLLVGLRQSPARYTERHQLVEFYDRLEREAGDLPGVLAVGASYDPPLRSNWYQSFEVLGRTSSTPAAETGALFRTVTPGYFRAAGVGILAGRGFTDADDVGAPGAIVVNDAFARQFLGAVPALGQQVSLTTTQWQWGDVLPRVFTVVGIAENERIAGIDAEPDPAFYLPYRQTPQHEMSLLVRSSGAAAALLPAVTRIVHALDPQQPVAESATIAQVVDRALSRQRLNASLAAGFALAALGLAALGVSAALADTMARRRPELAVRLALGSSPRRLIAFALTEGVRPVAVGACAGVLAALGAGQLVASQLYDVRPTSLAVHLGAPAAVLAVAILACLGPAWRASRVDPAEALRR